MRNVIVTGGSRGIGLGIVRCLAKTGYSVIALARRESPELREAIDEAASSGTGSIAFAAYDLAETGGMAALVKRLREDLGPVYALVNNVGMSIDGTLAARQQHADRAGGAAQRGFADPVEQIRLALDDGRRHRRPHRQLGLDHCLYWI